MAVTVLRGPDLAVHGRLRGPDLAVHGRQIGRPGWGSPPLPDCGGVGAAAASGRGRPAR